MIIREEMHGDQMYFISKGTAECFITHIANGRKSFERLRFIEENEYFGEISLVTCLKRTASVRSCDFVYCMKLERSDYNILESNFPHLVDEMKKKVREFNDSKMMFRWVEFCEFMLIFCVGGQRWLIFLGSGLLIRYGFFSQITVLFFRKSLNKFWKR